MGTTVSSGSRRSAVPEINVTPLVDVVLVLLIIFMVVTPQMESGEPVDLPSILFPDEEGRGKLDPIELTLTADGRFLLRKEAIAEADLEERLRALHQAQPDRRVVLRADEKVAYGALRGLFGMCERIGFAGVSLLVAESPANTPEDFAPERT